MAQLPPDRRLPGLDQPPSDPELPRRVPDPELPGYDVPVIDDPPMRMPGENPDVETEL